MALSDIVLRTTTDPNSVASTKGSRLTHAELDGDIIELLTAVLSFYGIIAPWDAGTTYTGGQTYYVSYQNNIYKFIDASNSLNEIPDATPAAWELSSIGAAIGNMGEPNQFVGNVHVNPGSSISLTSQRKNTLGCNVTFNYVGAGDYELETSEPRFENPRTNYDLRFAQMGPLVMAAGFTHYSVDVDYVSPTKLSIKTYADAVLDDNVFPGFDDQMLFILTTYQ